jgi:hypothetical protein
MDSPATSLPLRFSPGSASKALNWLMTHSERASKFFMSASVHQFLRFPWRSNFAPWSSKPWVISWPMTAPMAP